MNAYELKKFSDEEFENLIINKFQDPIVECMGVKVNRDNLWSWVDEKKNS